MQRKIIRRFIKNLKNQQTLCGSAYNDAMNIKHKYCNIHSNNNQCVGIPNLEFHWLWLSKSWDKRIMSFKNGVAYVSLGCFITERGTKHRAWTFSQYFEHGFNCIFKLCRRQKDVTSVVFKHLTANLIKGFNVKRCEMHKSGISVV